MDLTDPRLTAVDVVTGAYQLPPRATQAQQDAYRDLIEASIDIGFSLRFDTPFESGCIALNRPDEFGDFVGLDSDSVECSFMLAMITSIYV